MKILGISGFENAMPFKRAHWDGLEEREYRIAQGQDSAAALVMDGRCAAAAGEERFNRKKHSGDFPIGAIRYCLTEAGLTLNDLDEIVHSFDHAPFASVYSLDPMTARQYREVFSREALLSLLRRDCPDFPSERVHSVGHHLAHAASAYFTSGWEECLVVVIDGMGEVHGASVYHAHDETLDVLARMSAGDSIGILYSLVTLHLGFDFNADEYKIMGLAPYGNPERFRGFFDDQVRLSVGGAIRIPMLRLGRDRAERETYAGPRQFLAEQLVKPRRPDEEIAGIHCDVAAALQSCLDRAMQHICGHFARKTGLRRLALAGGVALNCTANGQLRRAGLFDEIYVQPAAGDDGSALGAALYRAALHKEVRNERSPVPFYGPAYPQNVIAETLARFSDLLEIVTFTTLEETCAYAAQLIAEGSVVAWYRGRMEFGPRALGHRSILANPGDPAMRDRINAMVKKREAFRPFAPAVSLEEVHKWFDVPLLAELPYMIMTVNVREGRRHELPAITHVNGSARVQTVAAKDIPEFHALLRAVGKTTGREMLLNTSFNVKGQPIVNTPEQAIETFLATSIDGMFLENIFVRRRQ